MYSDTPEIIQTPIALDIESLFHYDIKVLQEVLEALKVYELMDLQRAVENTSRSNKKKYSRRLKLIRQKITDKQKKQTKNFGKPLTPLLEDFLAKEFPLITDILQGRPEEGNESYIETPMSWAIDEKEIKIIKELVELKDGVDFYCTQPKFMDGFFSSQEGGAFVLELFVNALTDQNRVEFLRNLYKTYAQYGRTIIAADIASLINTLWVQYPIGVDFLETSLSQELAALLESFASIPLGLNSESRFLLFVCKNLTIVFEKKEIDPENAKTLISSFMKGLGSIMQLNRIHFYLNEQEKNERLTAAKSKFLPSLQLVETLYALASDSLQMDFKNIINRELLNSENGVFDRFQYSGNDSVQSFLVKKFIVFCAENDVFLDETVKEIFDFYIYTFNVESIQLLKDYYPELTYSKLMGIFHQTKDIDFLRFVDTFSELDQKQVLANLPQTPSTVSSFEVEIDDKLFAHIHNDHILDGTLDLQGHNSSIVLKYLYRFLSYCIANEGKNLSHPLKEIQRRMVPVVEIAEKLETIFKESKEYLKKIGNFRLSEVIELVYQKLSENNGELLMPGGWTGYPSGHAMLYEFKDNYFLIRNTGAGLSDYHQSKEQKNDVYYASIKVFKLPFSFRDFEKYKESLKALIRVLLEPQILPCWVDYKYTADKVYSDIIKAVCGLGAVEVDANLFPQKWTKPQRSGTCSYKVWTSSYFKTTLASLFPNESIFEKLHLLLRRYALKDYYQTCSQNKRIVKASVQRQLTFAIQNTVRMLPRYEERKLFTKSEKKEILEELKAVENALKALRHPRNPDLLAYQPGSLMRSRALRFVLEDKKIIHPADRVLVKDFDPIASKTDMQKPFLGTFIYLKDNPLASLEALLNACQYNHKMGYEGLVILHIDTFYFSIPNQDHEYLRLSKAHQKHVLAILVELNSLYGSAVAIQNKKPFAKHAITLNKGIFIAISIIEAYFSDLNFMSKIYSLMKTTSSDPKNPYVYETIVERNQKLSPYFITCNPHKNDFQSVFSDFLLRHKVKINKYSSDPVDDWMHCLVAERHAWVIDDLITRYQTQENRDFLLDGKSMSDLDKALYFLLKNFQTLRQEPRYTALIEDFYIVFGLQQLTHECALFFAGKVDAMFQPKLAIDIINNTLKTGLPTIWGYNQQDVVSSDIFPEALYVSKQVEPIEETQPKITDKTILQHLTQERTPSNVLLSNSTTGEGLNEKTCLLRTLASFRIKSETQVVFTVDFMKKHFSRLNNDVDIQNYVFLNLYFYNLLEKQLRDHMGIVDDLVDLIEKGFRINIQGVTLKESLFFFMKIALSLRQVLSGFQTDILPHSVKKLEFLLNTTLESLITQLRLKQKTQYNIDQLQKLYAFFIWNVRFELFNNRFLNDQQALTYFEAIVFRRSYADPDLVDPFVEAEIKESMSVVVLATQKHLDAIAAPNATQNNVFLDKIVEISLSMFSHDALKNTTSKIDFPVCYCGNVSLDLITGSLYSKGKSYLPLPFKVYNHPLFTQFFTIKSIPATVSPDSKTYEFLYDNKWYRFHIEGSQALLQQKRSHEGVDAWYEYIPDHHKRFTLPLTLTHFGIQAWASIKPESSNDVQDTQKVLIINSATAETLCCMRINVSEKTAKIYRNCQQGEHSTRQYLLNYTEDEYKLYFPEVAYFESYKFFESWVDNSNNLLIRFPRYNLEFSRKIGKSQTVWIFTQDPRYQIASELVSLPVPGFLASIVLAPLREFQHEGLSTLVLIPKQEFYCVEKKQDEEYYLYKFDIDNEVPIRRLLRSGGLRGIDQTNPQFFYFAEQEKYYTYTLKAEDQLIPESLSARLYLAYLYLAKRLPLLAYQTLKVISDHPSALTVEQIECLRCIVEELPAKVAFYLGEPSVEEQAFINSPEFCAVRLLAASMLYKQRLIGTKVDYTPNASHVWSAYAASYLNFTLLTRDYKQLILNMTKKFYESDRVLHVLEQLIEFYQNYSSNIPANMRLSEREEKSLLQALLKNNGQTDMRLFLTSTQENLSDDLRHLSDRLPLLVVKRNSFIPQEILIRDKFKVTVKIDLRSKEFPAKALGSFIDQHYEMDGGSLDRDQFSDRIITDWLLKIGHLFISKEIPAHWIYRYQQLQQPENFEVYAYKKVLVERKTEVPFDSKNIKLLKAQKKLLNDSTKSVSAIRFDPTVKTRDILSSFFDFCLIIQDNRHPAYQELSTKIQGYVRYLAQFNISGNDLTFKDNLILLLGFILHKTTILNDIGFLLKNQNGIDKATIFEDLCLAIEKLSEKERRISIAYPVLMREKAELLPLPDSRPAREPFAFSAPTSVLDDTWDFVKQCTEKLKKFQNNILATESPSIQPGVFSGVEIDRDYQVGVKENFRWLAQNKASFELYQHDQGKTLKDLSNSLQDKTLKETETLLALENEIQAYANKSSNNEKQQMDIEIKTLGAQRFKISLSQILYLYLCEDKRLYKQHTALDELEIQRLHQTVLNYLCRMTDLQHYERLKIATQQFLKTTPSETIDTEALNKVGELLLLERTFVPSQNSIRLLFEYFENKRIFAKQNQYLDKLSETTVEGKPVNQGLKLMMGDGKTTTIDPLSVVAAATGGRLSVISVPSALFPVNLNDLHETTVKLTGDLNDRKVAHPFIFDDSVDCSLEYLKNLRERLRGIIDNKHYLVTTRESMQSFELKFLRTLRFSVDTELNNKRIEVFNDCVVIFKESNVIMDEIDQALSVKKQLIQVVGKGDPVPPHEIKIILDLFDYIENIDISSVFQGSLNITLKDLLEEKITPAKEAWQAIIEQLVSALFIDHKSPLKAILEKLKPETDLKGYILGESSQYPSIIESERFSDDERDRIALYKELFSTKLDASNLLALCFQKSINEEIGLSRDPNKKGFERELSIPYKANNVPNENARHGHYLETLIYTIKIQHNKSLSEAVVLSMIKSYMDRLEKTMSPEGSEAQYQMIMKEFKDLTGCVLDKIEINDQAEFLKFYHIVKDNRSVKRYCLENHILNYVEKNGFTARSNAQNHASQFGSIQGLTGTDWNHLCYPHGMLTNLSMGDGIDGQTLDHLMRKVEKPLLAEKTFPAADVSMQYLMSLMHLNAAQNIHAWIDLGAYFKGLSNRTVATQFANYFASDAFKEKTGCQYRYVLFFDENNILWALKLADHSLIELERTQYDFVQRKLQCKPEHWFTYYDQIHGTGTDILQATMAHALVTLGPKTFERDLLQAVMRMRQLKKNQRIIFVVPKELQAQYPAIQPEEWVVKKILDIVIDNQKKRLSSDHYISATQKLKNTLRNDCMIKILKTPKVSRKRELAEIFEDVFFSKTAKSAFLQFKHITTMVYTKEVLAKMTIDIAQNWQNLMGTARIKLTKIKIKQFTKTLDDIVQAMLPFCVEKVTQPDNSDGLRETEVNIEKDQNTEKEQEQDIELDTELNSNTHAFPVKEKKWGYFNFNGWNLEPAVVAHFIEIVPLEAMVKTHPWTQEPKNRNWLFSPDIYVTQNFRDTCENQPQKLDTYKKEALCILMIQDNAQKTLKFLLLTPEEATYFKKLVLNYKPKADRFCWIETIHQTVFCGRKPTVEALNENYFILCEQLALLNNDQDVLLQSLNRKALKSWLMSSPDGIKPKMAFLSTCVKPLHKDKPDLTLLIVQKIEAIQTKAIEKAPLYGFKVGGQSTAKTNPPVSIRATPI